MSLPLAQELTGTPFFYSVISSSILFGRSLEGWREITVQYLLYYYSHCGNEYPSGVFSEF